MPTARGWLSASLVDGKLYAIGGGLSSQFPSPGCSGSVRGYVTYHPMPVLGWSHVCRSESSALSRISLIGSLVSLNPVCQSKPWPIHELY